MNRSVLLERARLALLEKELEMTRKEMELNKKEMELKDEMNKKEMEMTTEMKDKEVELTSEMKDKEVELANELTKVTTDWKNDQAALFKKQDELRDANSKLRKKNLELLKIADSVTLRAALGKCCWNFGERAYLLIDFYLGGSHLSLFPVTHTTPPTHRGVSERRSFACS